VIERFTSLGSQQMLEVMSFYMDAGLKSLCALTDDLINNGLPEV